MATSIKYWVVKEIFDFYDAEDCEVHCFKSKEKAEAFFEDKKVQWQESEHTADYEESDNMLRRKYMYREFGEKDRNRYYIQELRIFQKELQFED